MIWAAIAQAQQSQRQQDLPPKGASPGDPEEIDRILAAQALSLVDSPCRSRKTIRRWPHAPRRTTTTMPTWGDQVRILDNLNADCESNLGSKAAEHPWQLEFVHGDIVDPSQLDQALSGVETILHLAVLPSSP